MTVVEYGDLCAPSASPLNRQSSSCASCILDMAFVFRHFPLEEAHPLALMAAEAAEAAGAQGRF